MAAPTVKQRATLAKEGKAQTKAARGAPVGSYPTNTPARAVAAEGYATKAVEAGRMSEATKKSIDARAAKELGKRLAQRDKG
jgi:hypothetical protein